MRGGAGARVNRVHRKVPKNQAQLVAELPAERRDQRLGVETIGAFVVAVLEQRDRGIGRSLRVIVGRNGDGEIVA